MPADEHAAGRGDGAMKITWFGHSAFSLEFADRKILIDPFLKGNPAFEKSGMSHEKAIAGTTHIALTHGHGDHVGDALAIAGATGAVLSANFDLGMWLVRHGLEKFEGGNTGGTLDFGGYTITFVQAHHSSAHIDDHGVSHSLGNPNGLVFHIDGEKTVYHMGDTDIFGDMALINELHEPQVAFVPIGDRFTMGGAVAALACRRYFRFETILPCHYGSFPIIDQDASRFLGAMEGDAGKVKVLKPGGSIEA
jgi:L-ascorbate metabolism protein UlaG (beta-lactamase superfamily)